MESIRTKIIRIGNSRGVRIPNIWLKQLNFEDEVEMALGEGEVVIQRPRRPREGWDKAFKEMARHGDDKLIDDSFSNRFDNEEWEW